MAFIKPGRRFLADARRKRGRGLVIGIIALGTGLSAQSDIGSADMSRPLIARPISGGIRLALVQESVDTNLAALEGVLQVKGACVYVGGPTNTASLITPVFSFADIR